MPEACHLVTARRDRRCHGYRCGRWIRKGEDYARHVAFPGDVNSSDRPWVLSICSDCQSPAPMPTQRRKRRVRRG